LIRNQGTGEANRAPYVARKERAGNAPHTSARSPPPFSPVP